IVLGCTHFPILKKTISKVIGKDIYLVDSAVAVSQKLKKYIDNQSDSIGSDMFYVSDNEENFKEIADRILEFDISSLRRVKLGESWNVEKEIL
ncbi:MAG: glutamate racemase, partial [Candidatus Cloacimonadota bacterium]|nr:glutamate racemase [Candidatus Cloacimonadota bacterium]